MLSLKKNRSGVIIVIVLWVLIVLSLLAVGLGRQTNLDLVLTKHYFDKFQTKYYAFAGQVHAAQQIKKDTADQETIKFDTLYQCGIAFSSSQTLTSLFQDVPVGSGEFTVGYINSSGESVLGVADEERRININGINMQNYKIFVALLELLEVGSEPAQTIAYSVVDWIDADEADSHTEFGAENFYSDLDPPYTAKNKPFDSIEELLLVRGMSEDIFKKIKPFVTVFPKGSSLRVNFETAPRQVLRAIARTYSGPSTGSVLGDADSLVEKIIEYRSGGDSLPGTDDDRVVEMNEMPLNAKERSIFLVMVSTFRAKSSDYLRIRSVGSRSNSEATTELTSIVKRSDLNVLYWHRN